MYHPWPMICRAPASGRTLYPHRYLLLLAISSSKGCVTEIWIKSILKNITQRTVLIHREVIQSQLNKNGLLTSCYIITNNKNKPQKIAKQYKCISRKRASGFAKRRQGVLKLHKSVHVGGPISHSPTVATQVNLMPGCWSTCEPHCTQIQQIIATN